MKDDPLDVQRVVVLGEVRWSRWLAQKTGSAEPRPPTHPCHKTALSRRPLSGAGMSTGPVRLVLGEPDPVDMIQPLPGFLAQIQQIFLQFPWPQLATLCGAARFELADGCRDRGCWLLASDNALPFQERPASASTSLPGYSRASATKR